MSIFGEPLPHEDDTATTLIRRTGYPPEGTYDQKPQVYDCPCCSAFGQQQERDNLSRAAREEKELEHRRLMQLDVFDERAKPLTTATNRSKIYKNDLEDDFDFTAQGTVPMPPPTVEELNRERQQKTDATGPKLVVTVHHGKDLDASPLDNMSVIVRCGAFEGQTAKVPRGKDTKTTWDEQFEFPYTNPNDALDILVMNDAMQAANYQLLGGVIIPSEPLHDRNRGDEEPVPVMPEEEMDRGFDRMKEGPLGTLVVSWYLSDGGHLDEEAVEAQNLEHPVQCTVVAHRVFQYTDNGSEAYPDGVLCVLRDTEDNCSESLLYTPGSLRETSVSPYYAKDGYHYLPENPSQIMQLHTEKKLGHILICVPRASGTSGEEDELLVLGAVPLDYERLYHRGSAVLLIESKSKDDAFWGEVYVEWTKKPLSETQRQPAVLEVAKDSLIVTVVRGLNLSNRDGHDVKEARVLVATGELEGSTVTAPNVADGESTRVVTWSQEVRFIGVDHDDREVEVQVFEGATAVSVGRVQLGDSDEGVYVVHMNAFHDVNADRGDIVISYKRLHGPKDLQALMMASSTAMQDEEDEEAADEEREEGDAKEGIHLRAPVVKRRPFQENADEVLTTDKHDEAQRSPHTNEAWAHSYDRVSANGHDDNTDERDNEEDENAEDMYPAEDDVVKSAPHEEYGKEGDEEDYRELGDTAGGRDTAEEDENAEDMYPAEDDVVKSAPHEEYGKEGDEEDYRELGDTARGRDGTEEDENAEDMCPAEDDTVKNAPHDEYGKEGDDKDYRALGDTARGRDGTEEDENAEDMYPAEDDAVKNAPHDEDGEKGDGDAGSHDAQPKERKANDNEDAERMTPEKDVSNDELYDDEADAELLKSDHDDDPQRRPSNTRHPRHSPYSQDSGSRRHSMSKWDRKPSQPGFKQPWYPSGSPLSQNHLPFEKTNLAKSNVEAIRNLEMQQARMVEESVRRSSGSSGHTPRRE